MEKESLGLIETVGLIPAIEAADAGTKAANVVFRGMERARAGLITVMFTGDVAAVRAAVTAGAVAARRVGKVVSEHVIARPDRQLQVIPNGSRAARRADLAPKAEEAPSSTPVEIEVLEASSSPAKEVIVVQEAMAREVVEPETAPELVEVEIVEVPDGEPPRPVVETLAEEEALAEEEPEMVSVGHTSAPRKKDKIRKSKSKRKA